MTKNAFIPLFAVTCFFCTVAQIPAQEKPTSPSIIKDLKAEVKTTPVASGGYQGQLFWKNGDSLIGSVVSATPEKIVWKSPFFLEPLQIQLDAIAHVQFLPSKPQLASKQMFRIMMHNGDILLGKLIAVEDQLLVVESKRHGRVALNQEKIRTLRRINSTSSTYLGPHGIDDWKQTLKTASTNQNDGNPAIKAFAGGIMFGAGGILHFAQGFDGQGDQVEAQVAVNGVVVNGAGAKPFAKKKVPKTGWYEQSDGRISTVSNSEIFHPFAFPEQCEIEIILESKNLPMFSLVLGKNKTDCVRLESWEDTLVALTGYDFVELTSIKKEQRKIHLHLYLDKKRKQLAVYSHAGKKLGEVAGVNTTAILNGILLENSGKDLTLSYLRIDPWNGEYPQPLRSGESRVQLSDGSVQYGKIIDIDPQTGAITFGEAESKKVIPLQSISSITLKEGIEKENSPDNLQINWLDGGLITGTLEKIENSQVAVKTDYATLPIFSQVVGVNTLKMPQKTTENKNVATPDTVIFPGGTLRGELTMKNQSSNPIQWKPVGGLNASALSSGGQAKFIRGNQTPDLMFDLEEYPDVLFLKNNDVLPCQIQKVTKDAIEVAFPMAEAKRISHDQVKAIEFASSKRVSAKDFTDKKWTKTGSAKITTESVLLSGNATLANPDILTGDDIRFQLDWASNQIAKMTVFLNTDNILDRTQSKSKTVTVVEFMTSQENLWVEKGSTQPRGHQHFWGRMNNNNKKTIRCPGAKAKVRLVNRDGAVHVTVNGKLAATIPLNRNGAQEKGLFISSNYMGSHGGRNIRGRGRGNKISQGFRISKFEINSLAGSSVKQFILEEARQRTLMIPRFRRDDPPTHVIIAPNGDLLRGRLVGIDQQAVSFESQLETFRFERDRIASIIWLEKLVPEKKTDSKEPKQPLKEKSADTPPKNNGEIQLRLAYGYSMTMKPLKAESEKLKGKSLILGDCSLSASSIKELILGNMQSDSHNAFSQWIPLSAPEPRWKLPEEDPAENSLVGTKPKDFELEMLDGTTFKLSDHADKIIVLDFWATWCGPCVMALPGYIEVTSRFDTKKVIFVAVNQKETAAQVRDFLARQSLSTDVAFDTEGEIANRFGVTGIPHTVILSPGGAIEKVKIGFTPDAAQSIKETIEKILDGTWDRDKKEDKPTSDEPAL